MPNVKLDISMSLDGYVAGPDPTLELPLGKGGLGLHEWVFGLQSFREAHGGGSGEGGPDNEVVAEGLLVEQPRTARMCSMPLRSRCTASTSISM